MARQENPLVAISKVLKSQECYQMLVSCMPDARDKEGMDRAEQYAIMAYATIVNNPSLQRCTPNSFKKSLADAAGLRLPVDRRGLAYFVPYKNKQGNYEAQFQVGYLGLIDLAYRSGKVKSFTAHCIYESERERVTIDRTDGRFTVVHPYSFSKPAGNLIAVYATAEVEGLGPQTMVLRKDEVEKYRKMSKAPNSPAWKDHYEAMAKKTAIRQLAKFLPKAIMEEFHQALAKDAESEGFDEVASSTTQRLAAESGSRVVDTKFEDRPAGELPPPESSASSTGKSKGGNKKAKNKKESPPEDAPDTRHAYKWHCSGCGHNFDEPSENANGECCPECIGSRIEERKE